MEKIVMALQTDTSLDLNHAEAGEFLNDLQGNILKGHGRTNAAHLFVTFRTAQVNDIKAWIGNLARTRLTSALNQIDDASATDRNITFTTFSLSAQGCDYLDLDKPNDRSYKKGMQKRGKKLNDPDPSTWESAYAIDPESIHAFLIIANESETEISAQVEMVNAELEAIGCHILHDERGNQLKRDGEAIEHFGYRDGVSQPNFFKPPIAGNKDFNKETELDLVLLKDKATGKGYGSFLVFRKLEQNVLGFKNALSSVGGQTGMDPDLVGAMAVGRFEDGTPVVKHGSPQGGAGDEIDFNHDDDKNGSRCPFHAHTRKMAPRGEVGFFKNIFAQQRTRRLARRGITYDERPDANRHEIASEGVGLLFMCYQMEIKGQFEFVQRSWANNGDFLHGNVGIDPIIGQNDGDIDEEDDWPDWPTAWGSEDSEKLFFGNYVTLKGGEYFFTPSLSGLREIDE
jgi:Dyp-type peroxidase family